MFLGRCGGCCGLERTASASAFPLRNKWGKPILRVEEQTLRIGTKPWRRYGDGCLRHTPPHATSGGAAGMDPPPESVGPVEGSPGSQPPPMGPIVLAVATLLCAGAACIPQIREPALALLSTIPSPSGFVEALTLIFMSELGDKTFFIAALLAMRVGKAIAFFGSVISLGLMTVISVGIGLLFAKVPQFIDQSSSVGQYVGAALLAYFGIRSIMTGLEPHENDEELHEAEEEMEEAEKSGRIQAKTMLSSFWEVLSLIFIAEWGDRSMLATIALAVKSNPVGVLTGATLGHAVATLIAVTAGALASKYISEKAVHLVGGGLFLLFAAESALGLGIL
eukprot:jgi/Ulvmu1/4115/UM019_0094.1